MSVFRRRRTINGRAVSSDTYTVEVVDPRSGVARRLPTWITVERVARRFEHDLLRLLEARASGLDVPADLVPMLEQMPDAHFARLVEWDVLDQTRARSTETMDQHAEAWEQTLLGRGVKAKNAKEPADKVRRTSNALGWKRYRDATAQGVTAWLKEQRDKGMSDRTAKQYVGAWRAFGVWMREGPKPRAVGNPFEALRTVRGVREKDPLRALTDDELSRIMLAAETGDTVRCWTGPERALAYWVAVETGARRAELVRLTVGHVELDGDAPAIALGAIDAKNKKRSVQPVCSPGLVDKLRARVQGKFPSLPLLAPDRGAKSHEYLEEWISKAFQKDRARAGVEYRDSEQRVAVFHSLRHTFTLAMDRAGLSVKQQQSLMRHGSAELTVRRYGKALDEDTRRAVQTWRGVYNPDAQRAQEKQA